jgi:hypothetical protein
LMQSSVMIRDMGTPAGALRPGMFNALGTIVPHSRPQCTRAR